MIDFIAAIKT